MINFKISLLTPTFYNHSVIYLKTIITDFLDQQSKYQESNFLVNNQTETPKPFQLKPSHYEYTYNEKYSEEENNQKTLTFSMNKTTITADEVYDNPFINHLHVGSLLLLEDKYSNNHLFYVKNIVYNLNEFNGVYQITCQDAFSYLLTKQRDGYTIDNDPTSSKFIGALSIDDWAKKIVKECYINYKYLCLNDSLYQTTDGGFTTNLLNDEITIQKELKCSYNNQDHPELFTEFPFSASGSAGSVLINLGEQLGMHLKVAESLRSIMAYLMTTESDSSNLLLADVNELNLVVNDVIYLESYFWFEPAKNTERLQSSYYYSPRTSIENFGLTHNGESLTTVLNVEGPTINDEVISLFPVVTPFFSKLFNTKFWNFSTFYKGMFTDLCYGKVYTGLYKQNDETFDTRNTSSTIDNFQYKIDIIDNDIVIYIHWLDVLNPLELYDYISCNYESSQGFKRTSQIFYKDTSMRTSVISATTKPWVIQYKSASSGQVVNINADITKIDSNAVNWEPFGSEDYNCDFKILIDVSDAQSINPSDVFLTFKHRPSLEDIEFAKIADECPWLESKIIDFRYFLDSKIITPAEYIELMNVFQNELRKINGQLMLYSYQYYDALRTQTKALAQLTNELDGLGATIQANFISQYGKSQAATNYKDYSESYAQVFKKDASNPTLLADYNSIKADYLNKFFDAQQRFFKNIKNFKDYFEAPVMINDMYNYLITINDTNSSNRYTIGQNTYLPVSGLTSLAQIYQSDEDLLTYGKPYYPICEKIKEDNYSILQVADKSMLGELYTKIDNNIYETVPATAVYNPNLSYYKLENNVYTKVSYKEIITNFLSQQTASSKNLYQLQDLDMQKVTIPTTTSTYKINSILTKFTTYFNPKALNYIGANFTAETWDNPIYYKLFDAAIPISSYYDIDDATGNMTEYTAVNINNIKSFYRFVNTQYIPGPLGFAAIGADSTSWTAIQKAAQKPKNYCFSQEMNKEGKSRDLLYGELSEYNQSAIFTEKGYFDCDNPYYSIVAAPLITQEKDTVVGITPQLAGKWGLYYNSKQIVRVPTLDSVLTNTHEYILFPYDTEVIKNTSSFLTAMDNGTLNTVEVYPLLTAAINLPNELWFSTENNQTTKQNTITVSQLIANSLTAEGTQILYRNDESADNGIYKVLTGENTYKTFILCELRDYKKVSVIGENVNKFDINKALYDVNGVLQDPQTFVGLVSGYYTHMDEYQLASSFDINGTYFKKDSSTTNYYPIMGIGALHNTKTLYYNAPKTYITTLNNNETKQFTLTLNEHDCNSGLDRAVTVILDFPSSNSSISKVISSGNAIIATVSCSQVLMHDIIRTNGDFWYNYRNSTNSVLQTRAGGIEAQLTEYWTTAYYASKYCDYFLPEYWVTSAEGISNNYTKLLYDIVPIEGYYQLNLLSTLLPDVVVYAEGNQTEFPKYRYVLESEQETSKAANPVRPVVEMFYILDEDYQDWLAIDNGKTTYYYNQDPKTGCTWSEFLHFFFNTESTNVSGLYKMGFYLLQHYYKKSTHLQYFKLKEQQEMLWHQIYQNYNFLLLENTYKNEDATSSTTLLQLAQYAFKDYSQPEAVYDISIIDSASLKNYQGEEIRIGDGIRINSQDYYNLYDNVSQSLSQYLFVGSLSYSLRQATGISLQVNAIKYQDKLIQKLVKFIQ